MGVSTNLEGFAKSVFNQQALNTFNKLNTGWMIAYFFLLQVLQRFDLEGVMTSYIVFYWTRCIIAVGLASTVDPQLNWKGIMAKFVPSPVEGLSYVLALGVTHYVMAYFEARSRDMLGFLVCGVIGVSHLAAFAYTKRSELREFRAAIRN